MTDGVADPFDAPEWRELLERCSNKGLKVTARLSEPWDSDGPPEPEARVEIRGTAGPRILVVSTVSLRAALAAEIENTYFLGDHSAIWDEVNDRIEARIVPSGAFPTLNRLGRIPGVEVVDDEGDPRRRSYRLTLIRENLTIEISDASDAFRLLENWPRSVLTLKLRGFHATDVVEAERLLESLSGSLFFDLDARYSVSLTLAAGRGASMKRRRPIPAQSDNSPVFPRFTYPSEPLSLFHYGTSAAALPLLQYLAYYQAVEYFFPFHAQAESLVRVRRAISDPLFDLQDDARLSQMLNDVVDIYRGSSSERDQLKETLKGTVSEEELRRFILDDESRAKGLASKESEISGAPRILCNDGQPDVREQAALRVYAIRCRIVHTKQDSRDGASELLLPSSQEAKLLGHDIDLVRFLAQRCLVSSARQFQHP